MPASNPFTAIDLIIRDQILLLPQLAAIWKSSGKVQAFDRAVDIRRNFEDAYQAGARAIIMPGRIEINPRYSSGSFRFKLNYEIAVFSGKLLIESLRNLEWWTTIACAKLWEGIGPTGAPIAGDFAAPLTLEAFIINEAEQDRQPIDLPEEWESALRLTVFADGDKSVLSAL